MSDPHPDFADAPLPQLMTLGAFHLSPLTQACVEEDFEAVTASAALLSGLFGGAWPAGLTLEDNATDLHWHKREFSTARSFAWVVRDAAGGYLGCAYLYPDIGARGHGKGYVWLREGVASPQATGDLAGRFTAFLSDHGLPPAQYPVAHP
jgi:hypothetical protein